MKNVAIALGLVGLFAAAFAACSTAQSNGVVHYDDDMTNHAPSSDPSAPPTTQPTAPSTTSPATAPSDWPAPVS